MCRRISGLGIRRPDGDSFTECPLANVNDTVCNRCVGALSTSGVASAGAGSNIAAHGNMAISPCHLLMIWRRLISGRKFGTTIVNKDLTCLLSRWQLVNATQ